jgi:hypothetical protein
MLYYYFPFAGYDVPFPCFLSSNCVYLLKTKKIIESIWFLCLAFCHVVLTANVAASFSQQKKKNLVLLFLLLHNGETIPWVPVTRLGPLLFSSFVYSCKDYTFFTMFLLRVPYMSILRGVAQHCSLPYNTIRCIMNVDAL